MVDQDLTEDVADKDVEGGFEIVSTKSRKKEAKTKIEGTRKLMDSRPEQGQEDLEILPNEVHLLEC